MVTPKKDLIGGIMLNLIKNKYYNRFTTIQIDDEIKVFHSKLEANRFKELKILEKAGVISNLELQKKFKIADGYLKNNKKIRARYYISDFYYLEIETGKWVIEDVKGYKTDIYKLKKHLVELNYKDAEFREIF